MMNAQQATLLGLGCSCNQTETPQGLGLIDTPNDNWDCFQWVDWHKQLVSTYEESGSTKEQARAYAKTIFLIWWDKLNSFWGEQNWCGYKPEFFNYFKSVGVTEHLSIVSEFLTPIISSTVDVADSAGKILTKTGEVGESAAGAAGGTAKVLRILIPLAITAGVVGLGYYGYKHYIKGNEKIKMPKPGLKGTKQSKKVIHI